MSGRTLAVAIVMLLVVTGCNGDDAETTSAPSTTVTVTTEDTGAITAPTTTLGGTVPTTTAAAAEATTTLPVGLPEYTIRARTDDDVLVVLIEPGTYGDIDLQNVVADVVERFAPVNGLYLVDDEAAVEPVLKPEAEWTADERALLEEHYFLQLVEGFRIVFEGPFADVGEAILGS